MATAAFTHDAILPARFQYERDEAAKNDHQVSRLPLYMNMPNIQSVCEYVNALSHTL